MIAWYERDADRYEAERQFWSRLGFHEERSGGRIAFVGEVEVTAGGRDQELERRSFKIRTVYPEGFPYRPPEVEFLEPRIRRGRHQSPGGAPCLFPAREWHPFDLPTSEVENALRRWLKSWMLGTFPREQAIYELPEYFLPTALSILVSPEGMAAFQGRDRGTFAVVEAKGRDLAVLKSVDREEVAQDLLVGLRLDAEVRQQVVTGEWFRLHAEPPFLRDTRLLASVLREHGHNFSVSRKPADKAFVGLLFEDSVLGEERLLVLDYGATKKSQIGPKGWPLRAPGVYVVSRDELFRRLEGVHDVDALSAKNVVVLGVGAIGSSVALDLAREGVGGFLVCDPDRLRPGNVLRHALDLFSVGQPKAEAVEVALGRVNPYVHSQAEIDNLTSPDVLENYMRREGPLRPTHLVVSAIGDNTLEGLVSEIAVRSETAPVLFVRTLHNGDAARVMLLRAGQGDACLHCLQLHADDGHSDLIQVPDGELAPVFDAGCATASQPGAGLASRHAAIIAAKRACTFLLGQEVRENQWLWVDRAIPGAEDVRLHQSEQMYAAHLPVHGDCPFCRS